jgi:hypothetical protein
VLRALGVTQPRNRNRSSSRSPASTQSKRANHYVRNANNE